MHKIRLHRESWFLTLHEWWEQYALQGRRSWTLCVQDLSVNDWYLKIVTNSHYIQYTRYLVDLIKPFCRSDRQSRPQIRHVWLCRSATHLVVTWWPLVRCSCSARLEQSAVTMHFVEFILMTPTENIYLCPGFLAFLTLIFGICHIGLSANYRWIWEPSMVGRWQTNIMIWTYESGRLRVLENPLTNWLTIQNDERNIALI